MIGRLNDYVCLVSVSILLRVALTLIQVLRPSQGQASPSSANSIRNPFLIARDPKAISE
jgi:hypothetical protein